MKSVRGSVHLLVMFLALLAAGCGGSGGSTTPATQTTPVVPAPVASFSFSPVGPQASQAIGFTDTSTNTPSSWSWTFGDGGTSSAQNPTHAFTNAGSYTVTLVATNAAGSNSTSKAITVSTTVQVPVAAFGYSPSAPIAGQSVTFTDATTNGPTSWSWTFGDGGTSTAQSPTHTYTAAGTYSVTLVATNTAGSNSTSKSVTVSATVQAPVAAFSFAPSAPVAGQSVAFADATTNVPTSWSWTFGDGGTSSAQNPTHTYVNAGSYTVTLVATNTAGSNSTSKAITVSATVQVPVAAFGYSPSSPVAGQLVTFTDATTNGPTSWSWTFGDGGTSTAQSPTHTYTAAGTYTVTLSAANAAGSGNLSKSITVAAAPVLYPIVDTGQTTFYGNTAPLGTVPTATTDAFYGQDAQFIASQPSYRNNGDGTITDLNTGLDWVSVRGSQITWDEAMAGASTCAVGGHSDWRMPTLKELYSLIDFNGKSGATDAACIPYINTTYFEIVFGDVTGGRVIDGQDWSSTQYVSTTMTGDATVFGVNFIDGRIKGYPKYTPGTTTGTKKYVRYVRGNASYGVNAFTDNGNGTITDAATGLMWSQDDSGTAMNWQAALAWVQTQNGASFLGHNDWRLPNAKELQSLVDYTRSPATTSSAAIHALFSCTPITNEGGVADFPWYWTGTTHLDSNGGAYIAFGRGLGWMKLGTATTYTLLDVHGAGCQRSDPKSGSLSSYYLGLDASGRSAYGLGPQGDVIRITNFVRLVRTAN